MARRPAVDLALVLDGQRMAQRFAQRNRPEPDHRMRPAARGGAGERYAGGAASRMQARDEIARDEGRVGGDADHPVDARTVLRQPIETGTVMVARANAHIRYPCRFLLIAAANPCRCGHLADPARACARVPVCGEDYLGKVSGPLMDRFDLRIEVPAVSLDDLDLPPTGDRSAEVAARVAAARDRQGARFARFDLGPAGPRCNSETPPALLDQIAAPDADGRDLIRRAADRLGLTARGYHRLLRTARTIADLDHSDNVHANHLAEAISYRLPFMPGI